MWCPACQDYGPALSPRKAGTLECARCGETALRNPLLAASPLAHVSDRGIELSPPKRDPPPAVDRWADDDDLRKLRRLLNASARREGARVETLRVETQPASKLRFDPPQSSEYPRAVVEPFFKPAAAPLGAAPRAEASAFRAPRAPYAVGSLRTHARMSLAVWLIVSLGSMALVCGGVQVSWSLATGNARLWQLGLPVVAAGQAVLLLGLLLGLRARGASGVPKQVHPSYLSTLAATPHSPPRASEPTPQAVLAELRSQVERLGQQLHAA